MPGFPWARRRITKKAIIANEIATTKQQTTTTTTFIPLSTMDAGTAHSTEGLNVSLPLWNASKCILEMVASTVFVVSFKSLNRRAFSLLHLYDLPIGVLKSSFDKYDKIVV